MALIGIRELRENASEVIRKVREEKAEYMITYQGRPVAIILPVDTETVEKSMLQSGKQSAMDGWEAYKRLADELRREFPSGIGSQELLDDIRR